MAKPLCKILAVLTKLNKHLPYDPAIDSTPRCLPQRNKNMCSHKDFYTNVHRNFTLSNQKLATLQTPLRRRMGKHIWHTRAPDILGSKKKQSTDTRNATDEPLKHHAEISSQAQKGTDCMIPV